MLTAPLKKMRLTQPYGVNYGPTADFYTKLGLKAHNGWDLSCQTGTDVYAVMNGDLIYHDGGTGYGREMRIRNRELGLEVVYAHLESQVATNGLVNAGDLIAKSDNTGYSTGPHLHFGIRKIFWSPSGAGPYLKDSDNGYFGYIDPAPFFADDIFALPVDKFYGNKTPPSVLAFAPAFLYFLRTQRRVPTTREYNGLRYGYWPLRDVLDPAMFMVWSEMSYPEAKKRGIVK